MSHVNRIRRDVVPFDAGPVPDEYLIGTADSGSSSVNNKQRKYKESTQKTSTDEYPNNSFGNQNQNKIPIFKKFPRSSSEFRTTNVSNNHANANGNQERPDKGTGSNEKIPYKKLFKQWPSSHAKERQTSGAIDRMEMAYRKLMDKAKVNGPIPLQFAPQEDKPATVWDVFYAPEFQYSYHARHNFDNSLPQPAPRKPHPLNVAREALGEDEYMSTRVRGAYRPPHSKHSLWY